MNVTTTKPQTAIAPVNRQLKAAHSAHLTNEGFPPEQIDRWLSEGKIFSISENEARSMGFKIFDRQSGEWKSGSGLFLEFTDGFGQVRLDVPIVVRDKKGKPRTVKYLTPLGTKSVPMMPEDASAWTEGWKDAGAGSILGGIPTAAAAGISHFRILPKGSGLVTIGDSDAWHNPNVFHCIFLAGLHLEGKCAIVPLPPEEKAGLVEFFKSVKADRKKPKNGPQEYRALLDSALTPTELLLKWPEMWKGASDKRKIAMVKKIVKLAIEHLSEPEQTVLANKIAKASDYTRSDINKMMRRESQKDEDRTIDLDDRESRYKSICDRLGLDYRNCVTATTFDRFVYRKFDGKKKGESRKWAVLDQSFYKLSEDGSHWQLQDDLEIQRKIAAVGEKAFKLRVTGNDLAEPNFPYECDKYVKSAFAYSRTRLHCQQPDNAHLISFKNGTLDVKTGVFRDHNPSELLTRHIPHDYSPSEQCPGAFSLFVKESFGEDMLPVIRAFTAMFLDPSAPYGRFPHLIGQSGGGKGTLGRFWNSLYGENGSGSACSFEELATAEKRHQNLTGKSIWGIADIGGYVSGLRAFYELVDNGEMSGRALYSANGYNKRWGTRFWVASVDHLQIENAGDGWKRRAYPIPVRNRAVKPDPFLRQALEDCKAAVISWALAMPKEERDEILVGQPSIDSVMNAAREAELYSDSVRTFLDLSLRPSPTSSMDNAEMHSLYVAFCKAFGYAASNFYKFLSHLKTVIPVARVDRRRAKRPDGSWGWESAFWKNIAPLDGVFRDIGDGSPDESSGYQGSTEGDSLAQTLREREPQWVCRKSKTREGGLDLFEEFWIDRGSIPPDKGGMKTQQGFECFEPSLKLDEGYDLPDKGGMNARQGVERFKQPVVHPESNSYTPQRTATQSRCHDGIARVSDEFVHLVHPENETFSEEKKNNLDQLPARKNFFGESPDLGVYEGVRVEPATQFDSVNPCSESVTTSIELVRPESDPVREDFLPVKGWAWLSNLHDWYPAVSDELDKQLMTDVIFGGRVVEMLIDPKSDRFSRGNVKPTHPPKSASPKSTDCQTLENQPSSKPTVEQFEKVDFSTFPYEPKNSWNGVTHPDRIKEKKAAQLREALLGVSSQEDYDRICKDSEPACIAWVDARWPQEAARRQNLLAAIANSEQQTLF